jgi:flagellar M-ring protein FliF
VYVDQSAYDEAQIAVALEEGLRHEPLGIDTAEGGAAAIFMSSGERQQSMLKREWQETEHLLEQLDFVDQAVVTTSMPDTSPLRKREPLSVSVALSLDVPGALSAAEANTVAKLVRYRFGVPAENVLISDQSGNILYDPTADQEGRNLRGLLEHSAAYDRDLADKVNRALGVAFGERKALVTIHSQWDHDQSTTVAETLDPETVAVSSEKRASKTPLSGGGAPLTAGGIPGSSSNLTSAEGFGTENAAVPAEQIASAPEAAVSETSDERTTYDAARSRTQTVRTAPELTRLSVSLVIDESLQQKRDEIVELVKAAVGFDPKRQDVIGVSTTSFAVDAPPAEGQAPAAEEPKQPNPTLELLLQRGVEIVAALAFVIVLLKSLKGQKKRAPSAKSASGALAEPGDVVIEADPALVARAQIEELVRTNPRRVGEILSRWASEETAGAR